MYALGKSELIKKILESIAASNKNCFRFAASKKVALDKLLTMIGTDNNGAFREAVKSGHINILKLLAEKIPHELQRMIRTDNYSAFRNVAQGGHVNHGLFMSKIKALNS